MTDGVDLRSLLERVQKAQGPDRELDAILSCSFKFTKLRPARPTDFDGKYGYSPGNMKTQHGFLMSDLCTSSIDDALNLVSELLPLKATDILREAISAEGKRYSRHIALRPLDRVELARDVIAGLLLALITKAEREEGVGEF